MRKLNKLMALVLSLALCLSLAVTVSADNNVPTNAPDNGVYISKHLKVAKGTTVPAATFRFTFTADTNNSIGLQEGETCPPIDEKSLSYTSGMVDTGDPDVIVLRTDNILDDVTFPHAGVYAYTVKETANTYTITDSTKETMTYDSGAYTLRIYVVNSSTSNTVEIKYVTIQKDGKITTTDEGIKKETTTTTDLTTKATNNFKFENTYTKTASDPQGNSLVITNDTKGDFADLSKDFSYSLNITAPGTSNATTYTYVIYHDGSPVVDDESDENGVRTANYNASVEFRLDDDDKVEVKGVIAGSTYTLSQTVAQDYEASYTLEDKTTDKATSGTLTITEKTIKDSGNKADFVNKYTKTITPTGIELNNAPFMLLIGASALFLLLMLMSKKRREEA